MSGLRHPATAPLSEERPAAIECDCDFLAEMAGNARRGRMVKAGGGPCQNNRAMQRLPYGLSGEGDL
jgi:hypothetical protein